MPEVYSKTIEQQLGQAVTRASLAQWDTNCDRYCATGDKEKKTNCGPVFYSSQAVLKLLFPLSTCLMALRFSTWGGHWTTTRFDSAHSPLSRIDVQTDASSTRSFQMASRPSNVPDNVAKLKRSIVWMGGLPLTPGFSFECRLYFQFLPLKERWDIAYAYLKYGITV